jgi:hypothetical protein
VNFFDFLNSINDSKEDLLKKDPLSEKDYNSFMVNRGLSYFGDTILYANEMNSRTDIPKKWQYEFYLYGIKKKRRLSKWHKKDVNGEDLKLVMQEYQYSTKRALEVLSLLTEEQLQTIREKHDTGGR